MSSENPNYNLLPEHIRDGMRRYLENGIEPGGFLTACLENNFMEAVCLADDINRTKLVEIALFLWGEVSPMVWGSPEKVENYLAQKRRGLEVLK